MSTPSVGSTRRLHGAYDTTRETLEISNVDRIKLFANSDLASMDVNRWRAVNLSLIRQEKQLFISGGGGGP